MATSTQKATYPYSGNLKTFYDEANSTPANNETDVVKFTVPVGQTFICQGGSASGMTDAAFRFYIDNELKELKQNSWTKRNVEFSSLEKIVEGKELKITVEHKSNIPHDFSASIFGILF